jgi:hypothetical protein
MVYFVCNIKIFTLFRAYNPFLYYKIPNRTTTTQEK